MYVDSDEIVNMNLGMAKNQFLSANVSLAAEDSPVKLLLRSGMVENCDEIPDVSLAFVDIFANIERSYSL